MTIFNLIFLIQNTDVETTNVFRKYVNTFVNKKLGITDDGLVDDIPF
jgi:hypothetical protein